MSRKITQEAVNAFMNATKYNKGNTTVRVLDNVTILELHGNPIAYRYNDPSYTLSVTNCGYFTNTTKERLNGIPRVCVYQKKGKWYLNDKEWSGKLADITGNGFKYVNK